MIFSQVPIHQDPILALVYLLYIDLQPGQICHSKVMHRMEVTHSDGPYEEKSRRWTWLTKWDKVKFPWYTHRLMHQKRLTCELHDSYFRLMTIKQINKYLDIYADICIFICTYISIKYDIFDRPISIRLRMFTNSPGEPGSMPGRVIPK